MRTLYEDFGRKRLSALSFFWPPSAAEGKEKGIWGHPKPRQWDWRSPTPLVKTICLYSCVAGNLTPLHLYSFLARGWWARNAEQSYGGYTSLSSTPLHLYIIYASTVSWRGVGGRGTPSRATAATHLYHQRLYTSTSSTPLQFPGEGLVGEERRAELRRLHLHLRLCLFFKV